MRLAMTTYQGNNTKRGVECGVSHKRDWHHQKRLALSQSYNSETVMQYRSIQAWYNKGPLESGDSIMCKGIQVWDDLGHSLYTRFGGYKQLISG